MFGVMRLSIIIPALNEGERIAATLDPLADMRGLGVEVIVADGGSHDATVQRARLRSDRVVAAPRGRAAQINAGAAKATGDVLVFLDADTRLPRAAEHHVLDGLARSGRDWGCFDLMFEGRNPLLWLVAAVMNLRTRITGVASRDQVIFAKREVFQSAGGFPVIPLMEDIALCKRLKHRGRPLCLRARVTASGARFEPIGVLPSVVLMIRLRLAYAFGADPTELAERYRAAELPRERHPSALNRA